jgi:exodeoxyribonuclease-1
MTDLGSPSFYWYDLETSGTNPKWDRVMQFSGVRTDLDLNDVGDSFTTYVKLPLDVLPEPMSCVITGLTPQFINANGIDELQFFSRAESMLATPNTCVVGFNNLRFDDEFMRYGFYRHLIDPFAREWRNGNSRWDIIDLIRAAQALRPDGVIWPREEGLPTFRLSALTAANSIGHSHAHDASSDVQATIAIARLMKSAQPRLFQYYLTLRRRDEVRRVLNVGEWKMCLHVSGMFSRERNCIAPIVAIAPHPQNSSSVIIIDLAKDVSPLLEWSAERIREVLFAREVEVERPGLKEVRVNKCPFVAPLSVLRLEDEKRLKIDIATAAKRLDDLRASVGLVEKITSVYISDRERVRTPQPFDIDGALYDGFWGDADRARCVRARQLLLEGGDPSSWEFDDPRIKELIRRIRWRSGARNLGPEEKALWVLHAQSRLDANSFGLDLDEFRRRIDLIGDDESAPILEDLRAHATLLSNFLVDERSA